MPRLVRVTAPSRLHFGLWSLASTVGRQFGGVGVMIDRPGLRLSIGPGEGVWGPLAERTTGFARRWKDFHRLTPPPCRIVIHEAPPEHVGLGTGTQLALAVAAGLNAFYGLPSQTPPELALSVGRGLRSAVGTHGFVHGGLVVEQGKLPGEPISPLDCRIDLPEAWRFVLIRHADAAGLAGDEEAAAMASLPVAPPAVTLELITEVRERLVPAAAMGDFATFAASVYRYGNLSGQLFAARQGGAYHGPILAELVERIRALGFPGVGQSSWGPTLFVAASSADEAEALVALLLKPDRERRLHLEIAAPCNCGAQIEASA
jgi:beta-ribofuranosylaminobenzene 5'-phosphate synthase